MTIANAPLVLGRGWVQQDGLPPGFFFGGNANQPHLHLGLGMIGANQAGPWNVDYIGFRNGQNTTVIYNRAQGIDNAAAIQTLPANVQAEATWAHAQI